MIQNIQSKEYSHRVINEITDTLNNNLVDEIYDPKQTHGVVIGSFMDECGRDGFHTLYFDNLKVGYVCVDNGEVSKCNIDSLFREGRFAIYSNNINNKLSRFIGKRMN